MSGANESITYADIPIEELMTNGLPDHRKLVPALREALEVAEYQERAHASSRGGDYSQWGIRAAKLTAELVQLNVHARVRGDRMRRRATA